MKNIGELLVEISDQVQQLDEKEKDSFITESILNYVGADINTIEEGTRIIVKVK